MQPRPRLDCKFLQPKHCSMFRLYLTNFVWSWTNYAQKIRLVIYNKTVQLIIFLPTFNTPCMCPKIDVMEREWKNLEFWWDLNKA